METKSKEEIQYWGDKNEREKEIHEKEKEIWTKELIFKDQKHQHEMQVMEVMAKKVALEIETMTKKLKL